MKNSTAIIIIVIAAIVWIVMKWTILPDTFALNIVSILIFLALGISLGLMAKSKNRKKKYNI